MKKCQHNAHIKVIYNEKQSLKIGKVKIYITDYSRAPNNSNICIVDHANNKNNEKHKKIAY